MGCKGPSAIHELGQLFALGLGKWSRPLGSSPSFQSVQYLQILCPAFCCAKQFRRANFYRAFRDAVSASVEQQLEWRQDPAFTQNPVDRRHAEAVLELAYYDRDLRAVSNEAEAETLRQAGQLRRRRPSRPMATSRLTACKREQLCTRRGGHHPTMRYASSSAFDQRGGALW